MKRIALLTSGGDAPGMNAAIRAITRRALFHGAEVHAVRRGYAGLLEGDFVPFGARDVGRIIQLGGTILGSARCAEFQSAAGVAQAVESLGKNGIEGLIVIGGNGSQAGGYDIAQRGFPVVGVASTIDNDLCGTDVAIGVDTALNIALEAIDRLKVTALSHGRGFLVEVMGRKCGYIALMSGLAGGADVIVIPEVPSNPETVASELLAAYDRGKSHALAVVSEGAEYDAEKLSNYFSQHHERRQFSLRVTKLGHVQRGGAPTAFDRILATRLGAAAADILVAGDHGVLVGMQRSGITTTPFGQILGKQKPLNPDLFALAQSLAK
ncbi:MAG: ATP-dependent 6-phosphofructokinase [Chthoniobacterales bacterium]